MAKNENKTFKFGQLLAKEDICDRKEEIQFLQKICKTNGRALVYGPRRFGKTSVVKNVVMRDFLEREKKSIAVYADLFQLDSMEDMSLRLQMAIEQALSQQAKMKAFLQGLHQYLKNFRIEITSDPLSGAPTVTLSGQHVRDERSLQKLFEALKNLSEEYKTLLILDEFQDVTHVTSLEAKLRAEIQDLPNTAVILLGSRRHLLREMFHTESKPFYGFGTDLEFKKIPAEEWILYMQERFAQARIIIEEKGVMIICQLMRNVPNAIQELCHWIVLSEEEGPLTPERIQGHLATLIENKASRYLERLAAHTVKEKKVLEAIAAQEPLTSMASTSFLQTTKVSATAVRAIIFRLMDQGVLDDSEEGIYLTDPLFRFFLLKQFGRSPL